MKLLHLSSIRNRKSINKFGIKPSFIKNEGHYKCFKRQGVKNRQCIYTWDPTMGQSTDKYVKDMIYCKLFIHPRNDIFDKHHKIIEKLWNNGEIEDWDDENNWIDFSTYGTKLFGNDRQFDLYEINIDEDNPTLIENWYLHAQNSFNNKLSTTYMMNDKYSHDDKVLRIIKDSIAPDNFKIINTIKTRVYKDDTIGISFSKK